MRFDGEHILKGAPVADSIVMDLAGRIGMLREAGVFPKLALIRIGDRDEDASYARGACRRAKSLGVQVEGIELPCDASQQELECAISSANSDSSISGCLLLRPFPRHIDEQRACAMLSPSKDVDGITPSSLYSVFSGQGEGYAPCTASAVIELLDYYKIPLEGSNVVVIGRSLVVGRPLAMLLQQRNATVTMCHTKTRDIERICSNADMLIVAAGAPGCVGIDHTGSGQVVIDVGVNWDEPARRLVGDVDFSEVEPSVSAITPVPGGVGAVTTAVLMEHVVEAAERSCKAKTAHGFGQHAHISQ